MSYLMSDDEPLALPPILPTLMSSGISPPGSSENVLDMVTQDMMLGSEYECTLGSASTEVTYTSQYLNSSAAPYTSAGDVFLPSIPITTAANTFVKPSHAFPQLKPSSRNSRTVLKPNLKPASSKPSNQTDYLLPTDKGQMVKNPFAAMMQSRSRITTARSSTKNSSSRSQGFLSIGNIPSRSISRKKSRNSSPYSLTSRSKGHSILLINASKQNAFVPGSTRVSTTVTTHTITQPTDIVTESTVAFVTDTVTSTIAQTDSHHDTSITDTISSCLASKTLSSVNDEIIPGTNLAVIRSDYFVKESESVVTCTLTSCTKTRTTARRAIIAPMETTYTLPTSKLCSKPTIGKRETPPDSTAAGRSSEKVCEHFAVVPAQTLATTTTAAVPRPRTRLVIPYGTSGGMSVVATTTTSTISRVTYALRPTQSACVTSTITATSTAAPRIRTHSTFALSSAATLYTARKLPPGKMTRSRTAPVINESQTYAISDGKGSYTTLTISSDFTDSSQAHQSQSSSAINAAGVGAHTSSPDSTARPRNQLLIPIANSQMNPSTSLGYLVTSPIGSDIITARSSSAVDSTQNATATSIGSHTITTISSEALNRIRSRLIIPVAHNNVHTTSAGLGSLPPSTISTDLNRTRGPVTIIANQLISTVTQRDGSGTSIAATACDMARSLLSGATTQSLYAISGPIISNSSSITAAETSARPVSRVVIPIISTVHTTTNSQSLTTTAEVASSITTRSIPAAPTQEAYIVAADMGSSTSTDGDTTAIPSRMSIPIMQNTTTTTTVATTTNLPFPAVAGGSAVPSSISNTDVHSKLRSRLIVAHTIENSTSGSTTPVTAYTITRNRATQSLYAISAGSTTYTTSAKPPETMTLITIATSTSAASSTTSSSLLMASSACSESPSPTTLRSTTTPTPTLENTGNRYVIKLSTTPSGVAGASSVTAAVTTPITTAALSPPDHQFLEPRPVSRLRTFPAPRTYSVAQRSATGHVVRPAAHNIIPRATAKRCLTSPAHLQIFTDVVCPPTNTTTVATPVNSKPRLTLSHSCGNSTLVVPQYKNTVFKNLTTIAHPNPERNSSRYMAPRLSSDRFVLNRPIAFVTPRRLTPATQAVGHGAQIASSVTQRAASRPLRLTYADTRSPVDRFVPAAADSASPGPSPPELDAPNDQNVENL